MSFVIGRCVEIIDQLTKDERIEVLLSHQQKKLGHSLPLHTYLFKPVQRIQKYHLLLQVHTLIALKWFIFTLCIQGRQSAL